MSGLEVIEVEDGHFYEFNGKPVPGVSEIIQKAGVGPSFEGHEDKARAAAQRGTEAHLACWDHDRNYEPWWKGEELEPYVDAWALFKSDFKFVASHIERPMFHETLRYAGTPDRLGSVFVQNSRRPVTLDIKCTAAIGPHVGIQVAGYNELSGNPEERDMIAVQLLKTGKYRITTYDDKKYWTAMFLAALTIYRFKERYL